MAEVNEDSEDDCGVVGNKNPSYLLQSYKSFDILANHSTSYLSIWSCNRADIFGDKFVCFDEEKKRFGEFLGELKFWIHILHISRNEKQIMTKNSCHLHFKH